MGQGDAEMELKPRVKETGRKEASAPMKRDLGQTLLGRAGQGRLPVGGLSFWGSSLPWDFSSLKDLRRNVDFQSVPHFSCEDENEEFSTLHLGPESRSPLNTFKNQVVMYFMLSYLKPLEKFRSKGLDWNFRRIIWLRPGGEGSPAESCDRGNCF